jgi:hypothetical protein
MSFTLSGNLGETPFTDVVTAIRQHTATGTLTCTAEGFEKQVYVKSGQIIFAVSTDERDRLGEIMVKTGRIDRTQLSKALDLHKKNAGLKKIGAIFVELGYVTPKDLFNGLKDQVRFILHSLFLAETGTYQFAETMPSHIIIPLQIDMEELLRDLIQQMKQGQ